jgi:hypothetical protein
MPPPWALLCHDARPGTVLKPPPTIVELALYVAELYVPLPSRCPSLSKKIAPTGGLLCPYHTHGRCPQCPAPSFPPHPTNPNLLLSPPPSPASLVERRWSRRWPPSPTAILPELAKWNLGLRLIRTGLQLSTSFVTRSVDCLRAPPDMHSDSSMPPSRRRCGHGFWGLTSSPSPPVPGASLLADGTKGSSSGAKSKRWRRRRWPSRWCATATRGPWWTSSTTPSCPAGTFSSTPARVSDPSLPALF